MKTEVSVQYAKALFELANGEEKQEFYEALIILNKVIVEDASVLKVFEHPSITPDQKKEIIKTALLNKISDTFVNFLYVVIDHQRIRELKDILDAYKALLDDYYNVKEALVYTKYPLDNNQKAELVILLTKHYNKEIRIVEKLDASLMGGIKVVVDNEVLDATIINKLQKIKDILKG